MPSLADLSKMPMNQPMTFYNLWRQSISLEKAENEVLSFIPFIRPSTAFASPKDTEPATSTAGNITTYLTNGFQRATAAIFDQERKSTTIETTPVVEEKREKDPYGDRTWQVAQVPLLKDGDRRYLNEFSIRHPVANRTAEQHAANKTDNALVMLHGYGAGLAFFYRNFEPLSRRQGWTLYALDMLGMGRSARPPFKIHAKNDRDKVSEAEDWFIDAIEEWRVIRQLPQFTLVAHSMGGYMATAYALKYPGRLKKLILVSPVGVPIDPHPDVPASSAAPQGDLVEPSYADAQKATRAAAKHASSEVIASSPKPKKKSFLRRKKTSRPGSAKSSDSQSDLSQEGSRSNSKQNSDAESSDDERLPSGDGTPPPRRRMPKWAAYLWSTNFSPFSIIRWGGPIGAGLVSMWTERRFAYLPKREVDALHAYTYSLCRSAGSGEYAITYILAPGVFARAPLIERMHLLGRQNYTRDGVDGKEHGLPVVFLYGDVDWMDKQGGYKSVRKLEKTQRKALKDASEHDKALENGAAKVIVVKHAGHHVHLDGAEEFNEIVTREMMDVEERDARLAAVHSNGTTSCT